MDAKELRIGNLVNVPNKNQCPFRIDGFEYLKNDCGKVEMQTIPNVHPLTWEISDISPIIITEEILLKCGFKKSKTIKGNTYINIGVKILIININTHSLILKEDSDIVLLCEEVRYIHHLQNLYFALTGEELNTQSF